MVSPDFFTAPMFPQAEAALFAPVPPCDTSKGLFSFTGQPKVTV